MVHPETRGGEAMSEHAFADVDDSCAALNGATALPDSGDPDDSDAALHDAVRVEIGHGEIVITIRADALTRGSPTDVVRAADILAPATRALPRASRSALPSRAATTFVGLASAPADRYRGGYAQVQMRKDLVDSYTSVLRTVHALGGILTSSGGIRHLGEKATAGRSTTSLHYTGRAIDLFIYSGMQGGDEPYLVTRAGGTNANPEWEVFCVSRSPLTTHPLYDESLIEERELECVRWVSGVGSRTFTRRVPCFSLTAVMARHGWLPIPARSNWKTEYLSCEWWHFQNAAGLVSGVSTFGDELRQAWREDLVRASGLALGAVWAGRSFRASGAPPVPAVPEPGLDTPEKIRWAQTVLNAVTGTALATDGKFGARSGEALQRFQAASGIAMTGALDATTEIALVQRALERIDGRQFSRIGVIDDETVRVISAFQRAHGLKVDGRSGPKTRAAMVAALASAVAIGPVTRNVVRSKRSATRGRKRPPKRARKAARKS
jgi:peptidoglycan hydrolase-like protein with peptidoglycan-binding domain